MNYIFLLFFLRNFIIQTKSGHIYSQPTELIPQNAGVASTFNVFFCLETSLAKQDFLYIQFPFLMGSFTTAFISNTLDYPKIAEISTIPFPPNEDNTSDIQFFQLTQPLSANIWYLLQISPSDRSQQVSGYQGCISFQTTSDYMINSMFIYDQNPCFDVISFAEPLDNAHFTAAGYFSQRDKTIQNDFGVIHQVFFNIIPNRFVFDETTIQLTIEKDFSFGTYCTSQPCIISDSPSSDCPVDFNITQSSSFNCETDYNTLTFSLNIPIKPEILRIYALIQNPMKIANSRIFATFSLKDAPIWFANVTIIDQNGLEFIMKTKYSDLIETISNTYLFWGLTHKRLSSESGFIGCPIYLYQTKNQIIYNSFKTIFTISNNINSWASSNFLSVFWVLLDVNNGVSSFLMNSLSTNLPLLSNLYSSCNFVYKFATLECDGIGDILSQTTYFISGKFSIEPSFTFDNVVLAGSLLIQTGDSLNLITQSNPTRMRIKTNTEYIDSSITSSTSNKYYNQFFTYIYSNSQIFDFSPINIIKTIKNQFIGGGDLDSTPKSGIYLRKPSNKDIYGVFFLLYVKQSQICSENYDGLMMKSCVAAQSPSDSYAVLLKIIFNNNILNIDTNLFSQGAHIIGTLFKFYDFSNNLINNGKISDYAQNNKNLDVLSNHIDVYQQINNGGTFWHLSITCKSEIFNSFPDNSCYNILPFNDNNPFSVSGIGFVDTKITSIPSMYADTLVFDFILCFKLNNYNSYIRDSSGQDEKQWHLIENYQAGPGLFHAYVITDSLNSIKTSFANIYLDQHKQLGMAVNPELPSNFASYLRLSFPLNSDDFSIGDDFYVGIFLEADQLMQGFNVFNGLQSYADVNGDINIADFTNGKSISGLVLQASTYSSPNAYTYDYWWSHHGLLFPQRFLNGTNSVYVYIPLQISFSKIFSFNIVIFQPPNTIDQFMVQSIYRVYGSVFGSANLNKLTLSTYPNGVSHPNFPFISTWDYSISGSGCISNGTVLPGLDPYLVILPSQTYSLKQNNALTFKSDVSFNNINNCNLKSGNNENTGWGELFAVYINENENIFNPLTNLIWLYNGYNQTNKCLFHNFIYPSLNSIKNIYTILCSTDSDVNEIPDFGNNGRISLNFFTAPLYWGQNYPLYQKLQYIWSDPQGVAVLIQPEKNNNASTWIMDICKVSSISGIPENSIDASFILNLNNQINYNLNPGDSLTLKQILLQSFRDFNINLNFCLHKFLDCAISNEIYTLTNTGKNAVYLAAGTLSLKIYIDTSSQVLSTQSVLINYGGYDIEHCSQINDNSFNISGSPFLDNIRLSNLQFINMRNAKGSFSFSFHINRPIRPDYDFLLNLDIWLNSPLAENKFRCLIMENSFVSNDWKSFQKITSQLYILKTKKFFQYGSFFDFTCSALPMYNITDNTNYTDHQISMIFEKGYQGTLITNSNVLSPSFNLDPEFLLNSTNYTKTLNYPGFGSDYTFYFSPSNVQISLLGRIYLEFPRSISPKLNSEGDLECYLDENPAICEFLAERRIKVYPIYPLIVSKLYQVKILSVIQPNTTLQGENFIQSIYLALDTDDDPLNGISEQVYLPDNFSPQQNIDPQMIFIRNFRYTNQFIRNYTDLEFLLEVPSYVISDNNTLFVKLNKNFGHSKIFSLSQISCKLTRFNEDGSFDSYSSDQCIINPGREIQLFLSFDSLNSVPSNYTLFIYNVSTPQKPTDTRNEFQIYITDINRTTLFALTAVGNRNSEIYMSFITDPKKTDLYFKDAFFSGNYFPFYIGYFDNFILLSQINQGNLNESINVSIMSINNYMIRIIPDILEIDIGYYGNEFKLAGKSNLNQGLYIMQPSIVNSIGNFTLPNFFITKLLYSKCSPFVYANSFNVAYGGISNPIIIDFSSCIPESEVIITANLSQQGYLMGQNNLSFSNVSIITKNLSFQNDYRPPFNIYFYVNSENIIRAYNQYDFPYIGMISFQITGKDSDYYNAIDTVFLNLIVENYSEPNVILLLVEKSVLTVGCDQVGKNYYVIGLGSSVDNETIISIYNNTEGKYSYTTQVDSNDPSWKIYGYANILNANDLAYISLEGNLKVDENYTIYSYCSNLNLVNSTKKQQFNWIQEDNGGENSKITIVFNKTLEFSNIIDVACAISTIFAIPVERVLTTEGMYCHMKKQNSLSNASQALIQPSFNFSYDFLIIKDYKSNQDDTYLQVYNKANSSDFINLLNIALYYQNSSWSPKIYYTFSKYQDASLYRLKNWFNVSVLIPLSINNTYFNVTFEITNMGYIVAGISFNNYTMPSFKQLFYGFDGNNSALIQKGIGSCDENQKIWFSFNNLTANTTYFLFFAGSNIDTSSNTIFSSVQMLQVITQAETSRSESEKIIFSIIILCFILIINYF